MGYSFNLPATQRGRAFVLRPLSEGAPGQDTRDLEGEVTRLSRSAYGSRATQAGQSGSALNHHAAQHQLSR